jgi:hypothetical protein
MLFGSELILSDDRSIEKGEGTEKDGAYSGNEIEAPQRQVCYITRLYELNTREVDAGGSEDKDGAVEYSRNYSTWLREPQPFLLAGCNIAFSVSSVYSWDCVVISFPSPWQLFGCTH